MALPVDLAALGPAIQGVVEQVLDTVVNRAVTDPLDVHNADDVRAAVQAPANAAMATFVAPAVAGVAKRVSNRVMSVGSKVSFSVKALLAAVPPLTASVTLGSRELHALASLVVNQLRAAGLPVDRRFVQRVTVNAYVWPGGGRDLETPQPVAVLRVAGLWATRPLAGERNGAWVGRAADAIDATDLSARYARYARDRAELAPGS
jgi:hypothetical protein